MKGIKLAFVLSVFIISAYGQNYDESKVPPYTLPDALKTSDNTPVTEETWETIRRPEIVKLFENNIYGQKPKAYDSIKFIVKNENALAMGGRARLKEVLIEVFKIKKSVKINLVLFIPNKVTCPAAAFLLINNRSKDNTDPTRTIKSDFWPAEMVIDSGYAIAAFQVNDAAPDSLNTFQNGMLQLYPEQLTQDNGMKTIGAWAWAASRVMDYFEKDPAIDAKKVAVVGHSRGGKAALWAAAQDQRFAIPFSNCSGNTGAALARRRFGETVKIINDKFPYWFNNNYKKFNDNEDSLPVDQHMLMALMAPRPVYVTSASKDLWADPKGSFLSLKNAEKVYVLYGLKSNLPADLPPVNTPVINSQLGYHLRDGGHALTAYDWGNFIRFANYHHLKNSSINCSANKISVLSPEADAFVRNGSYAGKNYGSDTSLIVKGSSATGYSRLSYLKFSLQGINNVTSAKLRIYGRNTESTSGINLSVYGINTDSWTENGIYFSIAPPPSTSALSSVSVNNIAKYYDLDVTGFVQTQAAGDKIVSVLLKNPANQDKSVILNSKENRQNRPQLVITASSSDTTAINAAPVLAPIGAKSVKVGQSLSFTASATDVNAGQTQTFSLAGEPKGASINGATGAFSWTPIQSGIFTPAVIVTDNGSPAMADEEQISITVSNKADTLIPLADAFVQDGSYAGKNYGSDTSLIVKGSPAIGYSRLSYLKFSLQGISNVTSAKLRLYGRNTESTSGINLSVYGINTDSWTENGIYFSIAPPASTSVLSSASVNNISKYYELDVTGFVQSQVGGDEMVSVLIKNAENQDKFMRFNSKENKQNRPQLVITTSSSVTINSARSNANTNIFGSGDNLEKPKIFPNPLHQKFNIKFPDKYKGDPTLHISDETGKIYDIGKRKLKPGGQIEVDISKLSLNAGIYFLKIHSNERNDVIKLIVR